MDKDIKDKPVITSGMAVVHTTIMTARQQKEYGRMEYYQNDEFRNDFTDININIIKITINLQ